jgi:hypothetical protein
LIEGDLAVAVGDGIVLRHAFGTRSDYEHERERICRRHGLRFAETF